MNILLTKREKETFKALKEDIVAHLRQEGEQVGKGIMSAYKGIKIEETLANEETLVSFQEELVIDTMVMLHRVAGALISLLMPVKSMVISFGRQIRKIDQDFDKKWKKLKEEPKNESTNEDK
jgi:hypothetical protein